MFRRYVITNVVATVLLYGAFAFFAPPALHQIKSIVTSYGSAALYRLLPERIGFRMSSPAAR